MSDENKEMELVKGANKKAVKRSRKFSNEYNELVKNLSEMTIAEIAIELKKINEGKLDVYVNKASATAAKKNECDKKVCEFLKSIGSLDLSKFDDRVVSSLIKKGELKKINGRGITVSLTVRDLRSRASKLIKDSQTKSVEVKKDIVEKRATLHKPVVANNVSQKPVDPWKQITE